jgi:hypothetical protein
VLLFALSFIGHAFGELSDFVEEQVAHGGPAPTLGRLPHVVAVLVRIVSELAERVPIDCRDGVALRGSTATESPESKPVHAPA